MLKHPLLDAWHHRRPALESLALALRARLEALLEHHGLQRAVLAVHHRVKSVESLAQKLARPDKTYQHLSQVTDLVGLRVIAYFDDSLERVARAVETSFPIDVENSVDKRLLQEPSSFGYRSLHYVCLPPPEWLAEHPEWEWPFEIQIRTVLQHAWAEIEHDLGYKSAEEVPRPVRRRFSRLAGLLEIADHEFVELRRTMEDYARQVRQPGEWTHDGWELDAVSLASLAESPPVAALDTALASWLGKPLQDELFFPEYLLRVLAEVELRRPAAVLERVEAFSPRLLPFAERYFRFTREAFGFGGAELERVQRGYALALLAHWLALGQGELELHRAERLRQFYSRVDYPSDAEQARRVSRLFVRYFTDWKKEM